MLELEGATRTIQTVFHFTEEEAEAQREPHYFREDFRNNVCTIYIAVQNMGMAKCWPRGRVTTTKRSWRPRPHLDFPCTTSKAIQVLGALSLTSFSQGPALGELAASREVPAESWYLGSPGALRHPLLPSPPSKQTLGALGDPAWPDVPCLSKELKF